jgi:hypothetical protein
MRANWEAMFAGIPDFQAELCRSVTDGDTTWSEWHWSFLKEWGRSSVVPDRFLFFFGGC